MCLITFVTHNPWDTRRYKSKPDPEGLAGRRLRAGIDRSKSPFRTHAPVGTFGITIGTRKLRAIPACFIGRGVLQGSDPVPWKRDTHLGKAVNEGSQDLIHAQFMGCRVDLELSVLVFG